VILEQSSAITKPASNLNIVNCSKDQVRWTLHGINVVLHVIRRTARTLDVIGISQSLAADSPWVDGGAPCTKDTGILGKNFLVLLLQQAIMVISF